MVTDVCGSRLLELPPELRNIVYNETLVLDNPIFLLGNVRKRGPETHSMPYVPLLRTCKQIYREASLFVYEKNTFLITYTVDEGTEVYRTNTHLNVYWYSMFQPTRTLPDVLRHVPMHRLHVVKLHLDGSSSREYDEADMAQWKWSFEGDAIHSLMIETLPKTMAKCTTLRRLDVLVTGFAKHKALLEMLINELGNRGMNVSCDVRWLQNKRTSGGDTNSAQFEEASKVADAFGFL